MHIKSIYINSRNKYNQDLSNSFGLNQFFPSILLSSNIIPKDHDKSKKNFYKRSKSIKQS